MSGVLGCSPDSFTLAEMAEAAEFRLMTDFDRAANIMAALSSKPVSPAKLNPYRAKKNRGSTYTVEDCQRSHRVHIMGGRHIEQTITMAQVIHHDD